MKTRSFKVFLAITCTVIVGATVAAFINAKKPNNGRSVGDKGFAVVELFTSEGCSSCPAADALVAKVQKENADKPVYILAYHVDYWDRLGWKDVFSDASYTARQRQYARWLKLSSIYTPQVVVNGTKEFVGSEESTLRNTLQADLQKASKTDMVLSNVKAANGKAEVQYKTEGAVSNASLIVAIVAKNATTKVERGENSGRTLPHVQIVRKVQSLNLAGHGSGSISIPLPGGFSADAYQVIAFIQNTANGEITGATKAEFVAAVSK